MKNPTIKIAIFLYCIFLFSFGAWKATMEFKGDENFYFESSRYMVETGDILTPRYMDDVRFQKPILFYWLIFLAFKIFGVNWLAARLVSIMLGALCAILIFRIAEELFQNRKTAIISALFFATTPLCYRYARLAVPDMALVFFETLAIYFFISYYKRRIRSYVMAFFASIAFAFLIKGPVGAILPLLIVGIFWAFKRERLFRFGDILAGIILFGLIVTPWFYMMCKMYPGTYAGEVFAREIAQRLSWGYGSCFIKAYFNGFLFYLSALFTKFFPYSLLMPLAFFGRPSAQVHENARDGRLFLIIWAAVVFLFFTLVPERRTHYLLALAPAVSILTALLFCKSGKDFKIPLIIILALSLIYVAISISPPFGLFTNKMERAALVIKENMREEDTVAIGSHGIIPEELQVFFEEPVLNVKGTYTPEGLPSEDTVLKLRGFLNSPGRYFCVIKRVDYETFLPEEMRERLYVVDRYFVWKRRIKFDKEFKDNLSKRRFREIFQNEIYVVTNKR
ncbi:MAG: glycosyltransferase family 39 protein [Candidatus Omnitrophica bacterium]|nr:glycosyltransferase family 39 protein [Candidatus Omnitrophota bacterium]MBU4487890.1 glycosyltransferase family 39 protein [Candidatus Omnitrophota bacterium]MCG2704518.1 glycosyltransferase family 39 protein [Candidatus Omnitrophota bacterium]